MNYSQLPGHRAASVVSARNTKPNSVKNQLLEIIAQLGPEIRTRQLAIDFDLDEVPVRGNPAQIATAIRHLLSWTIERSPIRGELSITLIHSTDHWELELAGWFESSQSDSRTSGSGLTVHRQSAWLSGDDRLRRAETAAVICGGSVEVWRCPQGGQALVLHVPQRGLVEFAQRAA
ncbi:MAG TPA: hypothetical protein PKD54_01600 [Pirellulaceae bacterium]|nr:hypothetical protein [Pirellulaceae bacterium]